MKNSVARNILLTTLGAVVLMALGLVWIMTYFMNSLTDDVMLNLLQPMAKTAAQSVEGNLHVLADRFFLIRDGEVFSGEASSPQEITQELERVQSGIEFVWLGLYDEEGAFLAGNAACPRGISSRDLYPLMKQTENLVIEDTSVGNSGLEIIMGIPVKNGAGSKRYLVGSYRYDVLGDVLSNINIGANGTALITNAQGITIAHKSLGKVFGQEPVAYSLGEGEDARQVLELMGQGQTGSASLHGPQGQIYVSYSPIRGTNWSLGIIAPRGDFMSPVHQAISVSGVIILINIAIIALILILFIRRILTKPLQAIAQNARALATGDFNAHLPERFLARDDEIGQLSYAFMQMSDSIHSVIRDIYALTHAVRQGALGERIDTEGHQGDYHRIISGINGTLEIICSHLDAMPNAIALFNKEQDLIYMNRAMTKIRKIHNAALGQGSLLEYAKELIEEDGEGGKLAGLFTASGEADIVTHNMSLTTDTGHKRDYALSVRRIEDSSSDQDACILMILSDTSSLVRAIQEAKQANAAKTNFLANMSHEMRTPMNAIIGMTSIAKSAADVERKDYCLDKIGDASNHLLGVINDILDMSKIEANKFEISMVNFDFEKMLQKIANVIMFRVDEKQQSLTIHIDEHIPQTLEGDDQRIAQVIANLLSNAVKFTPQGGSIRVDTKLLDLQEDICTIRIAVTDTGIGVTEEQKTRLFRSFEQADSSTSRKFGGTGLGLAISKHIVEMMGGSIWIETPQEQGACFAFTIKARRVRSGHQQHLAPGITLQNVRVLVVDDAPDVLEYFEQITKQWGIDCDTASGGRQALDLIEQKNGYDICFVDWKMPGMDGIELAERIRDLSGGHSIVIMISGVEWGEIEAEARAAGVRKFLSKPLFPSYIADCINEALSPAGPSSTEQEDLCMKDCFIGRRLLLVEDVEINREVVMALLEETGIQIDCAENGRIAVEKFQAADPRYDIILMDVQMPEMDGYEATRRIRASAAADAASVPIIAMTANVFREDVERCLASGMNAHVGKPLDFEETMKKLTGYLEGGPGAAR